MGDNHILLILVALPSLLFGIVVLNVFAGGPAEVLDVQFGPSSIVQRWGPPLAIRGIACHYAWNSTFSPHICHEYTDEEHLGIFVFDIYVHCPLIAEGVFGISNCTAEYSTASYDASAMSRIFVFTATRFFWFFMYQIYPYVIHVLIVLAVASLCVVIVFPCANCAIAACYSVNVYVTEITTDYSKTTAHEARELAKKRFPGVFRSEGADPLDILRCIEDPIWKDRWRHGNERNYADVVCEAVRRHIHGVRAGAEDMV